MEWEKYYMDVILVPLGLVIISAYHAWLWHMIQKEPSRTIFGRDANGRREWVPAMMRDIDKKSIVAVQAIRNMIMGSTLMSTTSILLCAGLGAVISSTYSVKKPINDSVFGAHGEFMVALKFAILLALFLCSFFFHTLSIRFLNQVNILICTPQNVGSLVTPEYLTELFCKGTMLSIVGNRFFYAALPLLLWIFGPLLAFLSSVAMVPILYNLDFVAESGNNNSKDFIKNRI